MPASLSDTPKPEPETMPKGPMSVPEYATYCAPTVLAALLDVPRLTAAEYLTAEGANIGNGATGRWTHILESFGGTRFTPTDPQGEARYREARHAYLYGSRYQRPTWRLKLPTVACFLRQYPTGTYVLTTTSHTLLVEDGRVVQDTMSTKSKRARVHFAHRFPDGTFNGA